MAPLLRLASNFDIPRVGMATGALRATRESPRYSIGRGRAIVTHRNGGKTFRWSGVTTLCLASLAIIVASFSSSTAVALNADANGWQAFDPVAIGALVADDKTVFVDVSARWCLTCKVNELTVLQSEKVRRRLAQSGTVRMRADWSRLDPAMAAYIRHFGRFGVLLDVVYGPREPTGKLLPEVLGTAELIHALDDAGARAAPAAKIGS